MNVKKIQHQTQEVISCWYPNIVLANFQWTMSKEGQPGVWGVWKPTPTKNKWKIWEYINLQNRRLRTHKSSNICHAEDGIYLSFVTRENRTRTNGWKLQGSRAGLELMGGNCKEADFDQTLGKTYLTAKAAWQKNKLSQEMRYSWLLAVLKQGPVDHLAGILYKFLHLTRNCPMYSFFESKMLFSFHHPGLKLHIVKADTSALQATKTNN